MATVKFAYGTWDSFWGYQCRQCKWIMGTVEAGVMHEMAIDANGGECPQVERDRIRRAEPTP